MFPHDICQPTSLTRIKLECDKKVDTTSAIEVVYRVVNPAARSIREDVNSAQQCCKQVWIRREQLKHPC